MHLLYSDIRIDQLLTKRTSRVMAFSSELLQKCWFLAGPTACGKTAASLFLAKRLGAEIVALDSMTLYREMDIGTAKPSAEERSKVPHHLIDILDPHDEFSLAEYLRVAESVCQDILSRNRIPLFVGGTGLYLRGLLRGVFEGPPADWNLRDRLAELAKRDGPQSLWDQLHRVDPQTAARLHVNDQRRIVRALEVYELTNQPLSLLQNQRARPQAERPRNVYWISPPRDWLHQRIDERVQKMFADELIAEVKRLMLRPGGLSHTSRQALGYKEIIDWLESKISVGTEKKGNGIDVVLRLIQTRTRQFAKRQHTWFRNLEECRAIEISGNESPNEISHAIAAMSREIASKTVTSF
jgi:tRNA dimethylallyltransferase